MEKKVIIMIGVSGSGKSTAVAKMERSVLVCSADLYMTFEGVYRFDSSKLSQAHNSCIQQFITYMQMTWGDRYDVVVDNTNCNYEHVATYYNIARAYGYPVEFRVTNTCNMSRIEQYFDVCAKRNVHGVSAHTIANQFYKMRNMLQNWNPRWPRAAAPTAPWYEFE